VLELRDLFQFGRCSRRFPGTIVPEQQLTGQSIPEVGRDVAQPATSDTSGRTHLDSYLDDAAGDLVRDVLEAAPHGIALFDLDAVVIFANRRFERLFHAASGELIGRPFPSLIASRSHDADRCRRFDTDPTQLLDGDEIEMVGQRSDGSEFPITVQLTGLTITHGKLVRATVTDLTARKREEEALRQAYAREQEATQRLRELDRLKAEFISSASHELRTPLTVVMGFARMLAARWDTLDDPTRMHLVRRIAASGQRLEALIADMIDFTRVEAGQIDMTLEEQQLDEIVHDAIFKIRPLVEGHHLDVDIPPGIVVRADRAVLSRVIENLITHGVRSSRGGTHLRIDVLDDSSTDITVRVIDDGPTAEANLDDGAGGIGLTITKAFVEAQGGRMWIDHDADCGCATGGNCVCFTISRAASA
jgi:PAS domain S-box-containing protein